MADLIVSLILNLFIFIGTLVSLSPVVNVLISKELGYHVVLLLSYLAAVLGASYVAPLGKSRSAALIVASLFISVRMLMTISIWSGASFTEDTPIRFSIGTLAATVGLGLGLNLASRSGKIGT